MQKAQLDKIVKALIENHGFSSERACELIERFIDIVEVNCEETPEAIAIELEEQFLQGY